LQAQAVCAAFISWMGLQACKPGVLSLHHLVVSADGTSQRKKRRKKAKQDDVDRSFSEAQASVHICTSWHDWPLAANLRILLSRRLPLILHPAATTRLPRWMPFLRCSSGEHRILLACLINVHWCLIYNFPHSRAMCSCSLQGSEGMQRIGSAPAGCRYAGQGCLQYFGNKPGMIAWFLLRSALQFNKSRLVHAYVVPCRSTDVQGAVPEEVPPAVSCAASAL